MKKTIKGNLTTGARATKKFLNEIGEKYNESLNNWDKVGVERDPRGTEIVFKVDTDIYNEVLEELQNREEVEITDFETVEVKKDVAEKVTEAEESSTAKNLIAKGFKVWEKEDKKRIYINDIKRIVSIATLTTEYNIGNPKSFLREIDGLYYDMNTKNFEFRCNAKYRKDIEEIVNTIEKEINK